MDYLDYDIFEVIKKPDNQFFEIGTHVLRLFCNNYSDGNSAEFDVNSVNFRFHIIKNRIQKNEMAHFISALFHYFNHSSGMPDLARVIYRQAYIFLLKSNIALYARLDALMQMASWAFSQNHAETKRLLTFIKAIKIKNNIELTARRFEFLSTQINKDEPDFIESVEKAFRLRPYIAAKDPVAYFHVTVNYYTHIDQSPELLLELSKLMTQNGRINEYLKGNARFLDMLIYSCFSRNAYNELLIILRSAKFITTVDAIGVNHAFICPNFADSIKALSLSEITIIERNNGQLLSNLISTQNKCLQLSITTRLTQQATQLDKISSSEFGAPNRYIDFEQFKEETINFYELDNDFYKYTHSFTMVPSHNHPIQGCLCSIGVTPPIISISLQQPLEPPENRNYIFLLSSETFSINIEMDFIRQLFGDSAEIIIDPKEEEVFSILKNSSISDIYISAHGQYDHYDPEKAYIHFSSERKFFINKAIDIKNEAFSERRIILNICDGAATPISSNPSNSGVSAILAKNRFIVASHAWPVHPLYAAAWGCLMLFYSRDSSLTESIKHAFDAINKRSNKIECILNDNLFFDINEAINKSSLNIANFRLTGGVTVYG